MSVNGLRCHRGSCRPNRDHQYWYCEVDESGAWDYCCSDREECGRSRGFDSMDMAW